jgi:hypothetical protein
MKKCLLAIVLFMIVAPVVGAQTIEVTATHTIVTADSTAAGVMRYYKDTTISADILNVRDYNRLWFGFRKHAPAATAGTDTTFAVDSVEVYVQTSMDGTNWTTTALCNAPRLPIFATADSAFNITTTAAKAMKRDSTVVACGPLLRAMFVVVDTAAWVAGIKNKTYAWRFQLHVEGVK